MRIALSLIALTALGLAAPAVRAQESPAPTAITVPLPTVPPRDAIVLYSGNKASLDANWVKRYSTEASNWEVQADGALLPKRSDLVSKQQFGDFYLHVEFKTPTEAGHGTNAGVGLQGRYEVQIFGSYGQKPETTNAGAFYSQRPARVIASRKTGEWETYDILFRAPRFAPDGKVTEAARATVFHNGIVVQNNEAFNGPTGIQYGEFKGEAKTGPIILQGDHDPVQYRNVWIVPM